jgi:hypothetical protein
VDKKPTAGNTQRFWEGHGEDGENGEGCSAPGVDLAHVLDNIEKELLRYVSFPNRYMAPAIALWVAHTHVFEQFDSTGRLLIRSAEKQSGKTRLLEVMEYLVANPMRVTSPSAAVLYRSIEENPPSIHIARQMGDTTLAVQAAKCRSHSSQPVAGRDNSASLGTSANGAGCSGPCSREDIKV